MQSIKKNLTSKTNLLEIVKTSKKNPLTLQKALLLRNNGIDVASLQRTCQNHYITRRLGLTLYLSSPFTLKGSNIPYRDVLLDFSEHTLTNRVKVTTTKNDCVFFFFVDGNRDLFQKLLKHNLI
ncbi:structural protein [Cellulophaga phage Omtje_3]|uniref:Structural protein n=1 Tax=Cellulophaga phage Omtje_1 TaxID=2745694 RepID=A0A8E4ZLK5_9VIRU|nr:structural protein [Cellulophaga phage Omtje_1]QQV90363.1 structural protein [Cellulophaga phage Omtje_2]QQV90376.1 structural protein [Cellulophaga phage Omtje_3]QQV90389.1 structural protein [Cellulophaga phage Omtje_4]QQV90402.1 structural protein [Cellulophaga phage Omtje_5]